MERELRTQVRFAAFRQGSFQLVLWVLIGVLVAWSTYSGLAPHIEKVDLDREGRLIVTGRSFGGAKGRSALVFGGKDNRISIDVREWREHRIVALLQPPTSGSVTVTRDLWLAQLSDTAAVTMPTPDLPSHPYGYDVPVQPAAPWPLFRRDRRNSGQGQLPAEYHGGSPWAFQTGGAITATPVIDENGIAYFGSSDGLFYAVGADGQEIWHFRTAGPISSAAALVRPIPGLQPPSVIVPSHDGHLYRLSTEHDQGRLLWKFAAGNQRRGRIDSGFAGGIAIGSDGTIYMGSDDGTYHALTLAGEPKWIHRVGEPVRSMAAIDARGTLFWGGDDGIVRALDVGGAVKWTKGTLGVVAASPVVGSDGNLYTGSFDSHLYALTAGGSMRWTFKTDDHIAATAALSEDTGGNLTAIYVGSTDGRFYALSPKGALLWEYDTGDPIRSSAAVGLGPKGERPGIVYFGGSNGKLYALDAASGRRRWSFDTTPEDPLLRDRNDLGAVALGRNGIYVGSQSGALWHIPYDYCLHAQDARCSRQPRDDLPREHAGLAYVSPGGTTYLADPPAISPASAITLRLIVRRGGKTVDAYFCHTPLLCSAEDIRVDAEPPFSSRVEISNDGRYLHIVPTQILRPATDYRIRIEATYYTGGFEIGNLTLGGSTAGTIIETLVLRTQPATSTFPLRLHAEPLSALEIEHVALPYPTALASLHQAEIDANKWILGVIYARPQEGAGRGNFVMWGIGARRDVSGTLVTDPDPRRTLALNGQYEGDSFVLSGVDFVWLVGNLSIPLQRLELRGQLGTDLRLRPGAALLAKTAPRWVPSFDPRLPLGTLLRNLYDSPFLSGTYMARASISPQTPGKRPDGVRVSLVERAPPRDGMPGKIVADLAGTRYKAAEHHIGIVLIDRVTDRVVPIDYVGGTYVVTNTEGEALEVILSVPEGVPLSHDVEIVVVVDAFAVHRADLDWGRPPQKARKPAFWGR